MGLREQKKQRTREALTSAAMRLFAERGFDRVTVADVASAAGVAVTTVFNYFPAKEDLFFDQAAEVEGRLAEVVRSRPAGVPVTDAVRDDLLGALRGGEETLGLDQRAAAFWRIVAGSTALQARLLAIGERAEAALADVLAAEWQAGPRDALPRVLAGAIAGAHRAVIAEIRRGIVAGDDPAAVRATALAATEQAFAVLGSGLSHQPPPA